MLNRKKAGHGLAALAHACPRLCPWAPAAHAQSDTAEPCPPPPLQVSGLVALVMCLMERRYRRMFAQCAHQPSVDADSRLPPGQCSPQPSLASGCQSPRRAALRLARGAGVAEAAAGSLLGTSSAGRTWPQHGQEWPEPALLVPGSATGLRESGTPNGQQLSQLLQVDDLTQARLQHLRQCLNRRRPKYVTHFRQHQV